MRGYKTSHMEKTTVHCLFFNVLLIVHYFKKLYGAVAQLARAPALQAGGQEFDSPQLHHRLII